MALTKISGNLVQTDNFNVGVVTATAFRGDGSGLTGINITESQITDLNHFTNDDELDGDEKINEDSFARGFLSNKLSLVIPEWSRTSPFLIPSR